MQTKISGGGRKPRILWASVNSMLDTSSGAAITTREMLHQLQGAGYEVLVIGATVFDSELGVSRLNPAWAQLKTLVGQLIDVDDGPIKHKLLVTETTQRPLLRCFDELRFYHFYTAVLESYRPDLVFFYGGFVLDFMIPDEARARGIPTVAYLANGNYQGTRWARDIDLIVTNSQANAKMYKDKWGVSSTPIGPFVNPATVRAESFTRKNILAVNPSWEKGGALVASVALALEHSRPDIKFEVLESRGAWSTIVSEVTAKSGVRRTQLSNVIVSPHTHDMRTVFSRARVLLCMSLWWESFARVILEGMLNGVPAIHTGRGGLSEMAQGTGLTIDLPERFFNPPYMELPDADIVQKLAAGIIRLHDDQAYFEQMSTAASQAAEEVHGLERSRDRLIAALTPLLDRRAGDSDFVAAQRAVHRQGLA